MNIRGKLETAANAATIMAALLLSVVLVKVYLLPAAPHRPSLLAPSIALGTGMKGLVDGVDWQKNGRTLVLALSTQCHFCTASAPFFRTLVAQAGKNVKIVAVFPQPVDEAQRYLMSEGVRVDQIERADLNRIGVRGTPTMLLVDSGGIVTNVWVGKLQQNQQEKVLAIITDAHSAARLLPLLRTLARQP